MNLSTLYTILVTCSRNPRVHC